MPQILDISISHKTNFEGDNVFIIHRKFADVGKKGIKNKNGKQEVLSYREQRRSGEKRPSTVTHFSFTITYKPNKN